MFGLSLGEMVVLGGIALIAIDPKDLPQVAHKFGKFLNEIKRAKSEISRNLTDAHESARTQIDETRKSMNDVFAVADLSATPPPLAVPVAAAPAVVASPVELTPAPDPNEEQLAFQLTNFDDDGTGRGRV